MHQAHSFAAAATCQWYLAEAATNSTQILTLEDLRCLACPIYGRDMVLADIAFFTPKKKHEATNEHTNGQNVWIHHDCGSH